MLEERVELKFLLVFIQSSNPMSDEWLNAIVEVLFLFEIFVIKWSKKFNLTFFWFAKYDCVIKIIEVFSFLRLMHNIVTTDLSFVLLSISAVKVFYY